MKLLTITLCVLCLMSGCMIIKTKDVFVYTFAKTVDAQDLGIIADPNETKIGSGITKTKNDSVKASAIIGGVPVVIESDGAK